MIKLSPALNNFVGMHIYMLLCRVTNARFYTCGFSLFESNKRACNLNIMAEVIENLLKLIWIIHNNLLGSKDAE